MTFRDDGGRVEALPATDGTRLRLDERRCILNPGSVGQPRDGDPRASAMLIDIAAGEVEWRRIEYPVASTQRAMRGLPLPRPLADRLAMGR
jgi:diadenosine tetraphosphatase ApaH/serine/threonine PP2A family protein phosphatase